LSGFSHTKEAIGMFYWGLLFGLILGANIGIIVAGLLSRSKREEQAEFWIRDECGWVDTRPGERKKPSPKPTERLFPAD
jgi:hypothetical protein